MNSQLLLYRSPTGDAHVQVLYRDESFWMPQRAIAELFGVGKAAISKHLKNIFETGELDADRVVSILETTAADGKVYKTKHYNLDAVIAVGYRVNSYQATQFRIWATFIDRFLELSDYEILRDRGRISAEAAKIKAHAEYEVFRVRQDRDYISDFDREVQRVQGIRGKGEEQ